MKINRPAMSCGLRYIQEYGKMKPQEIIKQLQQTRMMATYVFTEKRNKAKNDKPTTMQNFVTHIRENKLGEVIESQEVYSPPGVRPKNWTKTYLWKVDFTELNKKYPI